jgi:hypothetical protein
MAFPELPELRELREPLELRPLQDIWADITFPLPDFRAAREETAQAAAAAAVAVEKDVNQ